MAVLGRPDQLGATAADQVELQLFSLRSQQQVRRGPGLQPVILSFARFHEGQLCDTQPSCSIYYLQVASVLQSAGANASAGVTRQANQGRSGFSLLAADGQADTGRERRGSSRGSGPGKFTGCFYISLKPALHIYISIYLGGPSAQDERVVVSSNGQTGRPP